MVNQTVKRQATLVEKFLTANNQAHIQSEILQSNDWMYRLAQRMGKNRVGAKLISLIAPSALPEGEAVKIVRAFYFAQDQTDNILNFMAITKDISHGSNPRNYVTKLFGLTEIDGNWYVGTKAIPDMEFNNWVKSVNRATLTAEQQAWLRNADELGNIQLQLWLDAGGKKFALIDVYFPRVVVEKDGTVAVYGSGGKTIGIFRPGSTKDRVFEELTQAILEQYSYAHPYDAYMIRLKSLANATNKLILEKRLRNYMHTLGKHVPVDSTLIKASDDAIKLRVSDLDPNGSSRGTSIFRSTSAVSFPSENLSFLKNVIGVVPGTFVQFINDSL